MVVLDWGCGPAPITIGLAAALPAGSVVGVDLAQDSLLAGRRNACAMERDNLDSAAADARCLPFADAGFAPFFRPPVLETVGAPADVVTELRRVTKFGGVVGAASVEYGGLILAGARPDGPRRFYDIRQQLWRAAVIAEPNMGRRLRGLFENAGFNRVEAFAEHISYGAPDL